MKVPYAATIRRSCFRCSKLLEGLNVHRPLQMNRPTTPGTSRLCTVCLLPSIKVPRSSAIMASTMATSRLIDHHCSVEPGSSVTNQDTAQSENNNAVVAQSPARDADLRSFGPEERLNAHNELEAAAQSSHSITNSPAMIDIAASRPTSCQFSKIGRAHV